jgi:hypothetical protein
MTIPEIALIITGTSTAASVLHSALPPWDADAFKPFPGLQSYYRLFIYFLGYIAINLRSTVYPSISIHNPDGLNANPTLDPPEKK